MLRQKNCACTFYLVFKEPALPDTDDALEARSRMRTPSGVSPLGEPYNLTSAFWVVSTPGVNFLSFSGVATSLQRNAARQRTAEGLCEPEGLLEDPATGRVTLGQIYAAVQAVSTLAFRQLDCKLRSTPIPPRRLIRLNVAP